MARWLTIALLAAVTATALAQVRHYECIYQLNPKTKTISEQCNGPGGNLTKDERAALLAGRASWCRIRTSYSDYRVGPIGSSRECQ